RRGGGPSRLSCPSRPFGGLHYGPPTSLEDRFMRVRTRISIALACAAVASTILSAADYTITVSQDRLNNAQNEPQNWLLMNGDYGSTRYSKLTQINRDN